VINVRCQKLGSVMAPTSDISTGSNASWISSLERSSIEKNSFMGDIVQKI
jgi:hypothetical protein